MPRSQQASVMCPRTELGRVHDGAQPGSRRQHGLVERRAAPAGDQEFGVRECGAGTVGGEVVEDGQRGESAHLGECGQGSGARTAAAASGFMATAARGRRAEVRVVLGILLLVREWSGWPGYLTAPAVSPDFQNRWSSAKARISGRTASSEPMITTG